MDNDPEPLAWARRRRLPWVHEAAERVTLVRGDVRRPCTPRVHVACGLNFSWWVFHQRADLLAYLTAARAGLLPGGVLVLNMFGGARAEQKVIERTRKRAGNAPDGEPTPAFTYIWEHAEVEAIRRRPVSTRVMEAVQQVGVVFIIGLLLFVTFNDVSRIFQRILP